MSKNDLKGEVLHSMKWIAAGRATTQVVSWLTTFWVIRLLTPDDYGVVALSTVVSGLTLMLIETFFLPVIVRDKDLTVRKFQQFLGVLCTVIVFFSVSQFILAEYIGNYYNSEIVTSILKVQIIGYIGLGIGILPRAMLTKAMEFKKLSLVAAVANLVASVITVILAIYNFGYWSLVIGALSNTIIRSTLSFGVKPIKVRPILEFRTIAPLIRSGGLFALHGIFFYIFLYMDVAIAGRNLTVTEVGIWAVCIQIATMPLKKILPLINQVAFPAFSKIQADFKKVGGYVAKAQRLGFLLTIPLFWGMAMIIDILIPLIIGEKWNVASLPTALILFVMPFRFSDELFNPALQGMGKLKHMITNAAILILIMFVSLLAGTKFGIIGLAYSWCGGFLLCYCILVTRNFKVFELGVKQFFTISYAPILSGFIMCTALYFLESFIAVPPIISIVLQVLIGSVFYIGSMLVLNKQALKEVLLLSK